MKKMHYFFASPTAIFVLLAVLALTVMGTTMTKPRFSDLHQTAMLLADESTSEIRKESRHEIFRHPGAIVRANVIGR